MMTSLQLLRAWIDIYAPAHTKRVWSLVLDVAESAIDWHNAENIRDKADSSIDLHNGVAALETELGKEIGS